MNRKYALAVVVLIAIAGVVAFGLNLDGDNESSPFNAYSADSPQTTSQRPDPDHDETGTSGNGAVKRVTRRVVKPVENTGNDPGPEPTAAQKKRHVKNRRPRTQAAPNINDGTLDKKDIRKGLDAATPLVKECYDKTLAEFPDAAGKVTVGFRIIAEGGEGRVEMTETDEENTTLFDVKLHDCLQESIADATFAAPTDGAVNVRFPFVFSTDKKE